jgi:hypothetical protein
MMKLLSGHRFTALLAASLTFLVSLFSDLAVGQGGPPAAPHPLDKSLKQFLQTLDSDTTTRYIAAFRDLNGDGTPEAIVYVISQGLCGSGGCNTFILQQTGDSWKVVGNVTITRPPIYVLASSSHGWRNIGVWVQGGGIQPGYEAELPFDGRAYAHNPTLPPARRIEGKPAGDVVMADIQQAKPLYDGAH